MRSFCRGSPADERLVLPLFSPYIEQGEIANLPAYSFYARISAVHSQEPMSGVTLLLEDDGNNEIAKRVIKESRKKYAKTVAEQTQNKPEPQPVEKSDDKPKIQHRRQKTNQPRKTVSNVSTEAKPLG